MKKVLISIITAMGLVLSCEKAPEEVAVISVSIYQATVEMGIGTTIQLSASVQPSNATDKTLTWTSSNQSVATVSSSGLVTAIAEGNSTITASAGGKSATCTVIVSKGTVEVSSITLDKEFMELVEGDTMTLTATVKPDDATDKTVTWSSSDATVASVDNGKITAIKEGEATITAKAGDKTAECKVTVAKKIIAVTSIELNKTSLELVEGDSETLIATVKPDDATDKSVIWSISDATVASVDNGKITAIKEGEATITAKAGDKTAECKVTVAMKVIAVTSIELNKTTLELVEGDSETLIATVKPDNATDKTVTWGTSDASIVTVEAGRVVALKKGEAIITVTAGDCSAKCTVIIRSLNDIAFADEALKAKMVAAFDKDGDGELSYEEAASVKSPYDIVNATDGVRGFKSFNEFQYFTGLQEIVERMFESWTIESIVLPNSITKIGDYAFHKCRQLETVILNEGLRTIADCSFESCQNLVNITMPKSLQSIGKGAFYYCSKIKNIEIPTGSVRVLTFSNCTSLESVTIRDENAGGTIEMNAFSNCTKLEYINIPTQTREIWDYAFAGCSSLKSKIKLDSVKEIHEGAFKNCTSLPSIEVVVNNNSSQHLTSIIDEMAFYGCVSLEEAVIDTELIGNSAFSYCTNLKSLSLSDRVRYLRVESFAYCFSLERLVLPESVSSIADRAFLSCSSLLSITLKSETPPYAREDMFEDTNNCPIFVPASSINDYKTADIWSVYADRIQAIP